MINDLNVKQNVWIQGILCIAIYADYKSGVEVLNHVLMYNIVLYIL